jgi:flagellar biosynthesis protein FliQ
VATPSGPIVLEKPIKDSTIREALEHLLPKYQVSRECFVVVIAIAIFMAFLGVARLLATYVEKLLAPFIANVMMRSAAASLMSTVLVVAGL